ncbi:MAG: hypothetical protein C0466_09955 [Candidatus Accumulibacter sp.]|nr:hypothetical protein [Accumulibacter sp.]
MGTFPPRINRHVEEAAETRRSDHLPPRHRPARQERRQFAARAAADRGNPPLRRRAPGRRRADRDDHVERRDRHPLPARRAARRRLRAGAQPSGHRRLHRRQRQGPRRYRAGRPAPAADDLRRPQADRLLRNHLPGSAELAAARPRRRHPRPLPQLSEPARGQPDRHADRPSNRKTFERSLARLLVDEGVRGNERENERRGGAHGGEENWLAIIDIDHFKRINDHFGHLYGDEVLILIANLMRRAFRQHDKLFRFGGEEFVVLLRGVSYENALGTLERFRQKVAEHAFPQVDQITASVGFAVILPQDTPNAVLGHADEALYFAKDNGRNQVFCYEKLIECGKLPKKMLHTEADFF